MVITIMVDSDNAADVRVLAELTGHAEWPKAGQRIGSSTQGPQYVVYAQAQGDGARFLAAMIQEAFAEREGPKG